MKIDSHMWIVRDVSNVAGFHAMFGDNPELVANVAVAHWITSRFAGLAANRFQQSITGRNNADYEQKLYRRINHVFL